MYLRQAQNIDRIPGTFEVLEPEREHSIILSIFWNYWDRKNTECGCVCLEISKAKLICREKPEETSTWDGDRGIWDRRRTLRYVRSLCRHSTTYQHDVIHCRLHRETQSIHFYSFGWDSDSLGWQRHTFVELSSRHSQSGTLKSTTGILTLDPSHNN